MAAAPHVAAPQVVIVDDDSDHALIVRLVLLELSPLADITVLSDLQHLGARLERVPEGALVLLDRRIDGTDGCALIAPLRAARPDLRVVLLSAHLSEDERARALAAGAAAAHEKPSSMADWRALLAGFVTRPLEPAYERPQQLPIDRPAAAAPALGAAAAGAQPHHRRLTVLRGRDGACRGARQPLYSCARGPVAQRPRAVGS